jgi:hypothetical protein
MYCWSSIELDWTPKPADAVTATNIWLESSLGWYWLYNTQVEQESFKLDVLLIKYWTWLNPKPADAVTTQTICSESLSLGMVLIIQLLKLVQVSKRMYCWSVLNLTVTPKPADAVTTQTRRVFLWNGTDYKLLAGTRILQNGYCWSVLNLTVT